MNLDVGQFAALAAKVVERLPRRLPDLLVQRYIDNGRLLSLVLDRALNGLSAFRYGPYSIEVEYPAGTADELMGRAHCFADAIALELFRSKRFGNIPGTKSGRLEVYLFEFGIMEPTTPQVFELLRHLEFRPLTFDELLILFATGGEALRWADKGSIIAALGTTFWKADDPGSPKYPIVSATSGRLTLSPITVRSQKERYGGGWFFAATHRDEDTTGVWRPFGQDERWCYACGVKMHQAGGAIVCTSCGLTTELS